MGSRTDNCLLTLPSWGSARHVRLLFFASSKMVCTNAELTFQTRQWTRSCSKARTWPSMQITSVALTPGHNLDFFIFALGSGRRKRSHWIKKLNACNQAASDKLNKCLQKHRNDFSKIILSCRYGTHDCFYLAECKHYEQDAYADQYRCEKIVHQQNWPAICCTPSSCWFLCYLA